MRVFRVFRSRSLAMLLALAMLSAVMGSFSPANATRRTVYDFTGGIHTDFVTLSAASATAALRWKVLRNPAPAGPNNAFIRIFDFGLGADSIVPGDRFGDGKFEPCVWRTNNFYCSPFPEGPGPLVSPTIVNWGAAGDVVAREGDYDGGGKDDYVVIRTISGAYNWLIQSAETGQQRNVIVGGPLAGNSILRFQGADFTGDAREEIIITYINNTTQDATWRIFDSITGQLINTIFWGNFTNDYMLQPDDYTGDGIADIAIWRAGGDGGWYIRNTATGAMLPVFVFGITDPMFEVNDIACRGDYDGDNIADRAVFRPSTREFFWIPSSLPTAVGGQQWGEPGDTALGTFFVF